MIGKKNVVFGFLYLVLTAALGPYMVIQFDAVTEAQQAKGEVLGRLQLLRESDFEDPETLEALDAEGIARVNSDAVLALNRQINARAGIIAIRGGPHAHGNLEALLNIAAGVALCFIAVARWFKQLISLTFILGALLHSGLLYLTVIFQFGWAGAALGTGIGPLLILAGLLLAGIAAAMGWRGEPVRDG